MDYFYEVLVGSQQYHGSDALTYKSDTELNLFSVVKVPLQKELVFGVVVRKVPRPKFVTKPIAETYNLPALPRQLVKLTEWLRLYYPAPLGVVAQQILPAQLTGKHVTTVTGITAEPVHETASLPPLTTEQQKVLGAINKPDTYVLHGDTGTGKTRVYIELVRRAIAEGRSAIILTPEISLSSQTAQTFRSVFGERVIVVHSQLTPRDRQIQWLTILKSSEPIIVLGPRSALFSPVKDLGLIVVDESHEPAYKQEQAPHYHAVRVASHLAAAHKATLVLGSATPPIIDYFIAAERGKPILRMTQKATSNTDIASKVELKLIDLKDRNNFSRSRYLSDELITSVKKSLERGEQSLLYLNRRGTARVILCSACGWQAVCPHCDLPLTYHHDVFRLQCHTCGYHGSPPTSCPECKNNDIVFKVVGTKAVEEEALKLFPGARVMRFDTDNKKADRFEQHYDDIRAGRIDILVGTQLLAKGLDLLKLTTLGVVIADTSLTFPDYSSEERTYQLLNQVIGRVGRGHSAHERIIVQSYDPTRAVIQSALKNDWDTFYAAELRERELFNFPPFCYVLKLSCRRASAKSAEKAADTFAAALTAARLPIIIEGPMPSFHARQGDKYEMQLVIKSKRRSALLEVITILPKSGWTYDIDPNNLL